MVTNKKLNKLTFGFNINVWRDLLIVIIILSIFIAHKVCTLQNKITENLSTKVRTKTKLKARCAKATLSSKQSNRDYTGKSHNVTKLQ